jgi:hypothetical protein
MNEMLCGSNIKTAADLGRKLAILTALSLISANETDRVRLSPSSKKVKDVPGSPFSICFSAT